jgi:pimeloyl-ACP methyl ester carboxylesterase
MPIPVVLVHDLGGSAADWSRVSLALGEHQIIAPDLPGHGTRSAERFSFESLTDTIAAACIEADSAPIVVGIGAGAHLAIASVGSSACGMIAVACGTEPLSWTLDSYRISSAALALLPDGGASVNDVTSQSFGANASLRQVIDRLSRTDVRTGLRALDVPVRLINGSRDKFRMQERAFLRAATDGRLVRVVGTAVLSSPALVSAVVDTIAEIAVTASKR